MKPKKILLIEDDPDIRLGLEVRLKSKGYTVISKNNATDGIQAASNEKPDLLILDLGLPDIHGFDVLKHLRTSEGTSQLPVIILTAQGTTENLTKALTADTVITFLEKPVSNEELLATIEIGLKNYGKQTK